MGLESWTFRFFVQWWSTCNPYTLYFILLESTLLYHGSTSLYHGFTPLHFTMVLFYSTWLFFTLPLVYFTLIHSTMALLDCTSLYYGSRSLQFIVPWLYWILFYCLHVSRDHRSVAWHWTQLGCAKRFILCLFFHYCILLYDCYGSCQLHNMIQNMQVFNVVQEVQCLFNG